MRFKTRLYNAMEDEGIDLHKLSSLAGISESLLRRYLDGNARPGLRTIRGILVALPNTDARWLICGDKK